MFDSIHEECGVFGIYENRNADVASSVYFGLYALQHRGQESCGITVCDDGVFTHKKADGLVSDVFSREELERLGRGNMAVTSDIQRQAARITIISSRLSYVM